MLASEIIYQVLGPHFNYRVAPHPIPEKFDMATTYVTYQNISNMPLAFLMAGQVMIRCGCRSISTTVTMFSVNGMRFRSSGQWISSVWQGVNC